MYQGGELFTIVRVSIIHPEKPPEDVIDWPWTWIRWATQLSVTALVLCLRLWLLWLIPSYLIFLVGAVSVKTQHLLTRQWEKCFYPGGLGAGEGGREMIQNYVIHEQLPDKKLIPGLSPHRNYRNKNLEKYQVKSALFSLLSGAFLQGLVFFHIKC